MDQVEPLYQTNVRCLHCTQTFLSSRVRPSFKKPSNKDSDFCSYYSGINPEYYVVRVCPHCGFASTENFDERMSDKQKANFMDKIGNQWTSRQFGFERTWDDALHCFKLALVCGQIKEEKPRVIAGILHHIAWLYREKEEKELESKFLEFALDAYIRVYETEELEINNARLMYMIGELSRRLKQYSNAVQWFSRVINDKRIMDSAMIKACRDQWATTREDMLAARLELPEEMKEA